MTGINFQERYELLQQKYEALEKKHAALSEKVRSMRDSQAKFFKYRASVDLNASRKFEREVDALIASEIKEKKSNQQELF